MTCRDVADFLIDYIGDELDERVREVFERHLRGCPNCREYLALYMKAVTLGRNAFEHDDVEAVECGIPEELVGAIMAAVSR